MILYIVMGVICGVIGFYVGVVAGVYCFMRDHGLLPWQQRFSGQGSHQFGETRSGGVER